MEKKFILATDSGCDISKDVLDAHEIYAISICYELDGKVYPDTMNNDDAVELYAKMREGAAPKTSQLNSEQFIEFWTPIIEEHHLPIVHICLGSAISGTYNSGVLAAEEIRERIPGAQIYVVDSTLASTSYGMIALEVAEMRDKGCGPEEAVSWIEENKKYMQAWYTTDTLKYLYRSGRVSRGKALLADALNVCPILNLDLAGHLINQEKVRGVKKSYKRILDIVEETAVNVKDSVVYVSHSDAPEKVKWFVDAIKERFDFKEIRVSMIGPTIGANCGPDLIAVFFKGTPRTMKGYEGA